MPHDVRVMSLRFDSGMRHGRDRAKNRSSNLVATVHEGLPRLSPKLYLHAKPPYLLEAPGFQGIFSAPTSARPQTPKMACLAVRWCAKFRQRTPPFFCAHVDQRPWVAPVCAYHQVRPTRSPTLRFGVHSPSARSVGCCNSQTTAGSAQRSTPRHSHPPRPPFPRPCSAISQVNFDGELN